MLFGEYSHQIDAKGRLRLPAKFKSAFSSRFVITQGDRGCLYVFSNEKLMDIQNRLKNVPLGAHGAQDAIRAIFASAFEVEEDPQGRFVLPQKLRKYADIDKNITIIGVGDRAEIWAEERYNQTVPEISYGEALEKLAEFGI